RTRRRTPGLPARFRRAAGAFPVLVSRLTSWCIRCGLRLVALSIATHQPPRGIVIDAARQLNGEALGITPAYVLHDTAAFLFVHLAQLQSSRGAGKRRLEGLADLP